MKPLLKGVEIGEAIANKTRATKLSFTQPVDVNEVSSPHDSDVGSFGVLEAKIPAVKVQVAAGCVCMEADFGP